MSKRIFQAKAEPVLPTSQGRIPTCYYHKHPITQFCVKKKCTLPLCLQCLSIHKKEHISNKQIPNEGILQFQTARDDALNAFRERREEIEYIQNQFKSKIEDYKKRLIDVITSVLDKFCQDSLVTDGNLDIVMQIQQRTSQIKQGSLKQLIRYYEDIHGAQHFRKLYKMYTGEYLANFKFQADKKALERLCKDGIKNLNYQQQKTPLGHQQVSPNDMNSIVPKNNEENGHLVLKDHQIPQSKRLSNNNNYTPSNPKNIISEQDEESQISSYQLLKSKKKIQEANIYTHHPTKMIEQHSKEPSNNNSNVSKTSKGKKKGLSLTKSYKQLPGSSSNPSIVQPALPSRQNSTQHEDRKSNWKNFVNMRSTRPESDMILASEPSTVLNPKQMRQMIARKKVEEKQKELKVNKSVDFLSPHDRMRP